MRVLQISPYYAPHHGGVESFVRDISVELSRMGHEVTVLTSRYMKALPEEEKISGVRVLRVPLLATLLRTPIPSRLSRFMRGIEADIVHGHTPPPSFSYVASSAMRYRSPPFVLTYHCDSDVPLRALSPLIRAADRFITGKIVSRARRVMVTSWTYSSTSINTWKIESEIIPVSADVRRFHPDVLDRERMRRKLGLQDKHIVLFVGRLVRHKGVSYLMEAMRYMDRDVTLLIAGDGEYAPHLKRFMLSRQLEDKISMLGDVPDDELPSLYRAADVVVIPSTSRLEAFSIAAIEAMACGTPLVVSDIPGVREVIRDGLHGFVCPPMNPEAIAEKLRRLFSNEELRMEMGSHCVERAAVFSSEAVASKILSVYRSVTHDGEHHG
ncbi:MAG: glycosyltransferase family 4 protein [Methanomassiliicoccales archaeon]